MHAPRDRAYAGCADTQATEPASTGSATPVTNEASSEHSQTTAAATSAGSPNRRHRLRGEDLALALGRLVGHQRGHDRAGADRVDADAVVGVLDRGVLGQAEDAVLAGGVRAEPMTARSPAFDEVLTIAPPGGSCCEHLRDLMLHARGTCRAG